MGDFLGDRLRFYEAAVMRHRERLSELRDRMEKARKEKDAALVAALHAEELRQGHLLQWDMEREAAQQQSQDGDALRTQLAEARSALRGMRKEGQDLAQKLEQACLDGGSVREDLAQKLERACLDRDSVREE